MLTGRNVIRSLRRKFHHRNEVCTQLETDQRTYGSINRENSPTFAGWKNTPVTDLIAVLNDERVYEVMLKERRHKERRPVEEEDIVEQC